MPKVAKELSALEVKNLPPGSHAVGGVAGLTLEVTPTGGKTWGLRIRTGSRRREIGLGGYPSTSLAEARVKAREVRGAIEKGTDPVAERQAARAAMRAQQASLKTFGWCARSFVAERKGEWKNAKHQAQWAATLETYAIPLIGELPVQSVGLSHVLEVLKQQQADNGSAPLWEAKTETASRLRGRIESVLNWATVHGYRDGPNPARWKGHLDAVLKAPNKIQKPQHHKSIPYTEMHAFMRALRKQEGTGARALEFAILCAARSGEVRGATWKEFDLKKGLWTVPGVRMKAGKPHNVPLSKQALKIIEGTEPTAGTDLVFPSPRGKELSDMTLSAVMRRMKLEAVPHGFRSTFRTWGGEYSAYPRDLLETALAHTLESKVEAAYMHGTQIEKRRELMQDWADYVDLSPSEGENAILFSSENK